MEISAKTRLLTVIGDPVAHSLSPAMHNAACRALGLDAVYVALQVSAESLPAVLAMQAAVGGAGNVTVPHKEAVEGSIARKTDVCARVGACNTFWTEDGELVGDNTDVFGVAAALDKIGAARKGERWLVVGTGGSARATAVTAADRGATLFVRSRDASRAKAFAAWATGIGVPTSVATGGREGGGAGYAPGETRWVHTLRERGIEAMDGREMLVQQGAAAFERFFPGTAAPKEVMRAAVQRALRV